MLNSAHNLGQAIGQSIRESSARGAREAELRQQQAMDERAHFEAEQIRQKEEGYQRLTGSLKGIDGGGSIAMKTGSGGETLALKFDSDVSDSRTNSSSSFDASGLKLKGLDDAKHMATASPPESSHFLRGLKDANECFSGNAFGYCTAFTGEENRRCTDDYHKGYQKGEQQILSAMARAFELGRSDAITGKVGNPNRSFNDPHAEGPCRMEWIINYNRGYFEGKNLKEK